MEFYNWFFKEKKKIIYFKPSAKFTDNNPKNDKISAIGVKLKNTDLGYEDREINEKSFENIEQVDIMKDFNNLLEKITNLYSEFHSGTTGLGIRQLLRGDQERKMGGGELIEEKIKLQSYLKELKKLI